MNCKKPKSSYLPERPLLLNAEKLNEIFFTITTKFCSFLMVYASNTSILKLVEIIVYISSNQPWMKFENYVIYHKSILYSSIFQNQFLGRSSQIHEKSKKTKNTVSVGFFKDRNSTEANMKVQLVNSKKKSK